MAEWKTEYSIIARKNDVKNGINFRKMDNTN